MAGKAETKGSSLSSNLLNMKFMKRGGSEPVPEEAPSPALTPVPASEGWTAPGAQKFMPKKVYKSPVSVGFSDLEAPSFGRMVWKNGQCKQVVEDSEEKTAPPSPEPAPVKKRSDGKSSSKRPKKKAKR